MVMDFISKLVSLNQKENRWSNQETRNITIPCFLFVYYKCKSNINLLDSYPLPIPDIVHYMILRESTCFYLLRDHLSFTCTLFYVEVHDSQVV